MGVEDRALVLTMARRWQGSGRQLAPEGGAARDVRQPSAKATSPPLPAPCGVPGITRAVGRTTPGAAQDVGVYHLRAVAEWGGQSVEQYCAVEVMPTSPAAPAVPRRSGLPVLFSMANEYTRHGDRCL